MTRSPVFVATFAFALVAVQACEPASPTEAPAATIAELGDPNLGHVAFEIECAGCHATRDGFDLAFFAFTDTTIVRRAVAHVDTSTALDIVAYVRTLRVAPASQDERLFQPGSVLLASDVELAERLFGVDAWPAGLTTDDLLAIDPLETPVAVALPIWSVEEDNLDWMPNEPLDGAVLGYRAGLPQAALDMYYGTGSLRRLENAVSLLRAADRDADSAEAPCVLDPLVRLQPEACFETRRWVASLGAQHMLREGISTPVSDAVHDMWWDVGNVARKSIQRGTPIEHALENWVSWMYAGWAFNPDRHASTYLARGLAEMGLPRHAGFHALRAAVARPAHSHHPFTDVATAAQFAPAHWVAEAVAFGYRHALERLDGGLSLSGEAGEKALGGIMRAYNRAAARSPHDPSLPELLAMRDEIVGRVSD